MTRRSTLFPALALMAAVVATHGAVMNVIGRDGRFATEIHGLRFGPIDLYVTGLTTVADGGEGATDAKW